ncbi:MAG TPA: STAS domain-containing protein [Steroidobacteraceae bacterium]|nr:STAS domain-containing protein [Steroidobacteraceae bacterium]
MSGKPRASASLDLQDGARAFVKGALHFDSVGALLPLGTAAIAGERASVIDLAGVSAGDSAGLALLIEWLSVARGLGRKLRYEHMPRQLQQLADLSEVEELLLAD